jgi:HlyD family secretion protein
MIRVALLLLAVGLIVGLGFVIDAESRIAVDRSGGPPQPCLISAPGRIEGATQEIGLRFLLTGRIDKIPAKEGQSVAAGDVLMQLEDSQYRHELALASAELRLAEAELQRLINGAREQERREAKALCEAKQAELEQARLAWDRARELLRLHAESQEEADNRRTRFATLTAELEAAKSHLELIEAPARPDEVLIAQAKVEAAKARRDLATTQLDRTSLRAPSAGKILMINAEPGELTGPEAAEPVLVMVDTSKPQVRAFIEELDAPRVRCGMRAKITVDGLPGQEFEGRVARVSPQMTRKRLFSDDPAERYDTKAREVWIALAPCESDALVVGLRVDVMIDPQAGSGAEQETATVANHRP